MITNFHKKRAESSFDLLVTAITNSPAFRFALTGIANTLVHVAVAIPLIEWAGIAPGWANGIAFAVANVFSYVVNSHWSFRAKMGLHSWLRFILVSLVAWGLTVAIAVLVDAVGGHYLLGIAAVVTTVPVLSYISHSRFTYAKHQIQSDR